MRTLDTAIAEQQKIASKRGSLDHNKIGYYLMSMPSETIATLCVLHLMRHLFKEFVSDIHKEADQKMT
jgi:DNA polymerase III delta prime subunit